MNICAQMWLPRHHELFFLFFLLPRGARRHRRPADMLKFTAGEGASDTGRGSGSRGMSSNRSSSTARLVSITQAADERQITLSRGPGVCRPPLQAPATPPRAGVCLLPSLQAALTGNTVNRQRLYNAKELKGPGMWRTSDTITLIDVE